MFLQLAHTKLEVFRVSQELVLECYKITKFFPNDERFAMVQQIRRAVVSVHLNIAEGCSRSSKLERARFFEIARGSLIEVDSAIGIAHKLAYITSQQLEPIGYVIVKAFKLITGLIKGMG